MVELVNIFSNIDNIILIKNSEGLHAELCVVSYLIMNNLYEPFNETSILFGISKLCCKLCACGMFAVGMGARQHYRAIHGNFYNNWMLPQFIISNNVLLKRFLGESAYSIYEANKERKPSLLKLIPADLGRNSKRGSSASCESDSEVE